MVEPDFWLVLKSVGAVLAVSRIQDECLYEDRLRASVFRETGSSSAGFCRMLIGGRARWLDPEVDGVAVGVAVKGSVLCFFHAGNDSPSGREEVEGKDVEDKAEEGAGRLCWPAASSSS